MHVLQVLIISVIFIFQIVGAKILLTLTLPRQWSPFGCIPEKKKKDIGKNTKV